MVACLIKAPFCMLLKKKFIRYFILFNIYCKDLFYFWRKLEDEEKWLVFIFKLLLKTFSLSFILSNRSVSFSLASIKEVRDEYNSSSLKRSKFIFPMWFKFFLMRESLLFWLLHVPFPLLCLKYSINLAIHPQTFYALLMV